MSSPGLRSFSATSLAGWEGRMARSWRCKQPPSPDWQGERGQQNGGKGPLGVCGIGSINDSQHLMMRTWCRRCASIKRAGVPRLASPTHARAPSPAKHLQHHTAAPPSPVHVVYQLLLRGGGVACGGAAAGAHGDVVGQELKVLEGDAQDAVDCLAGQWWAVSKPSVSLCCRARALHQTKVVLRLAAPRRCMHTQLPGQHRQLRASSHRAPALHHHTPGPP